MTRAKPHSQKNSCRISMKALPFKYTNRMTWVKYLNGLTAVHHCIQSGMLSMGVNKPPVSIMIIMKKNMTNMACCMVSE